MLPITSLLSCTAPIDEFECFSLRQKHQAKTYVTGLVAGGNKTVDGIPTHLLPERANTLSTSSSLSTSGDTDQLNRELLALLQSHNETTWSREGIVDEDDTFTHKTDKRIPNVGKFFDHTKRGYI